MSAKEFAEKFCLEHDGPEAMSRFDHEEQIAKAYLAGQRSRPRESALLKLLHRARGIVADYKGTECFCHVLSSPDDCRFCVDKQLLADIDAALGEEGK